MSKASFVPELLLPAGSVENFRAAVEGGADAIYLGLRQFNARGRASNFTHSQLVALLEEVKEKNIKVYVTLNTVIKNDELSPMLDTLSFLSKINIDAVIIQDWGVYYLIKKYFPNLRVHASTQMGNHNSLGANYSEQKHIERVILARELTKEELQLVSQRSKVDLEYFVHGALCYSFSGMCLFSSYLGGVGANRGMCAQPCRRTYSESTNPFMFSLKDNQLIDELDTLKQMGIASIKIEGRMKSAEYVYTTASSYRQALDNIRNTQASKQNLKMDMGRDKTAYFFGGNVKEAITNHPNTGIYLGKVIKVNEKGVLIESNKILENGFRIRFVSPKTEEQNNLKITKFNEQGPNRFFIDDENSVARKNDKVFLIGGLSPVKFSNKIKQAVKVPPTEMPKNAKQQHLQVLGTKNDAKSAELFIRIDSLAWLRKVWLDKVKALFINLTSAEIKQFDAKNTFLQKNINKIWLELPKFIPEKKIDFYQIQIARLYKQGIKQFVLSHMSQKLLLPQGASFALNENVYVFNDAAARFMKDENAQYFSYPLENDFGNMYAMKNRSGIVPLYYYPDLFYSRMPVSVNDKSQVFQDDAKRKYKKLVKDGMTIVRPEVVVSQLKHRPKMEKLGYKRFLVDFSNQEASKHVFNKVMKAYQYSEAMNNTTNFNLRRDLK